MNSTTRIPLVLWLAALAGGPALAQVREPSLRLRVPDARVAVGERLDVTVSIRGARNARSTPFHVTYDDRVLKFVAGEELGLMSSDGATTAFFASQVGGSPDVAVGLSRLDRPEGMTGSGALCVLHFDVVGPGEAALELVRAKVKDASGATIPVRTRPLRIRSVGASKR